MGIPIEKPSKKRPISDDDVSDVENGTDSSRPQKKQKTEGGDQATKQIIKSRSRDEFWSLIDDLKEAASLPNSSFVTKSHRLSDLFIRQLYLRDRYPNHWQTREKSDTARELKSAQVHHLCNVWHRELLRQIQGRRRDLRRRDLYEGELKSASDSLERAIRDVRSQWGPDCEGDLVPDILLPLSSRQQPSKKSYNQAIRRPRRRPNDDVESIIKVLLSANRRSAFEEPGFNLASYYRFA